MNNDVFEAIRTRRSVRTYQDRVVEDEKLQAVVEAGQYAPNTSGEEPWHFTVVLDRDIMTRMNQAAKEVAQRTGIPHLMELGSTAEYDCLYGAPVLIIISGDENGAQPEADCAAAMQNMLLAAESIGLGTCWIYFIQMAFQSSAGPMFRRELKIPEGFRPVYAAALGYKADPAREIPPRKKDRITYIL